MLGRGRAERWRLMRLAAEDTEVEVDAVVPLVSEAEPLERAWEPDEDADEAESNPPTGRRLRGGIG